MDLFRLRPQGQLSNLENPADGGTAEQVTRNGGFEGVEGRDGRDIYYVKREEQGIWTASVAGGRETQVLNQGEEGMWALGARGIYLLSKGAESAITLRF